jgi:hypothetical protein
LVTNQGMTMAEKGDKPLARRVGLEAIGRIEGW